MGLVNFVFESGGVRVKHGGFGDRPGRAVFVCLGTVMVRVSDMISNTDETRK